MVSGATIVVGVIGNPIEHSLSPRMHNAAFEYLGLDYVYIPLRVLEKDLKNAVRGAKAFNFSFDFISFLSETFSPKFKLTFVIIVLFRRYE